MGWFQAVLGLLSHKWAYIQHLYLQSLGAKVTGLRWISSIIRKLWDTAWDTWNHLNHTLHTPEGPFKMALLIIIIIIIIIVTIKGSAPVLFTSGMYV